MQGGSAVVHSCTYQFNGVSNWAQIATDTDVASSPANLKTVLAYNAANELLTTSVYNGQGVQQDTSNFIYDVAGNQTGNTGYPHLVPPSPPLSITYNQHNQTTSVTDVYQHPVTMTYTGVGQFERTSADWSNVPNPTDPTKPAEFGHTTYTHSALGLMSASDPTGTTYYTRDSSGLPIGERTPTGVLYYVFDGAGSVVMLVDPPNGAPVVIYDPCPTGNAAGGGYQLAAAQLTSHNYVQDEAAFGGITDWGTRNVANGGGYRSTDASVWTQLSFRGPVRGEQCPEIECTDEGGGGEGEAAGAGAERREAAARPASWVVSGAESYGAWVSAAAAGLQGSTSARRMGTLSLSPKDGHHNPPSTIKALSFSSQDPPGTGIWSE